MEDMKIDLFLVVECQHTPGVAINIRANCKGEIERWQSSAIFDNAAVHSQIASD